MAFTVDGSNGLTFPDSTNMASATALGMRNRIINGAMMIDQRNAGAAVTPNNSYTLDRWQGSNSQTSKYTVQQSTTAPSGFKNSLLVTSSSAYTVGAAETFLLQQKIEGLNVSDLAWGSASAATVTLSFWVRSSLTGTFGGSLTNSANDRAYPFSYPINSANTWEYKTITIAGDTTGTWLTTNGIGITLNINLGTGSTLSGTSGAWAGSTYYSSTGAVSVVGTNAATFYITGVQLERGTQASPFEWRPFGVQLALCQRYYSKSYDQSVVPATNTAAGMVQTMNGQDGNQLGGILYKQTMRAAPTLSVWSKAGTAASVSTTGYVDAANTGSWGGYDVGDNGCRCIVGTGGLTAASAYNFHYVCSAEL